MYGVKWCLTMLLSWNGHPLMNSIALRSRRSIRPGSVSDQGRCSLQRTSFRGTEPEHLIKPARPFGGWVHHTGVSRTIRPAESRRNLLRGPIARTETPDESAGCSPARRIGAGTAVPVWAGRTPASRTQSKIIEMRPVTVSLGCTDPGPRLLMPRPRSLKEEEGGVDYPAFTGTAAGMNPAACSGTSSTTFHASRSSRTRFAKAVCSAWPARWATRCPMIG